MNEQEAVLYRLRELLEQKREKLRNYLTVLEQQENDIVSDDVERLEFHVELEREVLGELAAVQRVIVPLQAMGLSMDEDDVDALSASLDTLRSAIKERKVHNQELLSSRMEELSGQIDRVSVPPRARSVYENNSQQAALVDIVL